MFEYHGWLVITPTGDHGLSDSDVVVGTQALRGLRWVDGQAQLHFGGFGSRRSTEFDELVTSVADVARRAPGAYGLIQYAGDVPPHDELGVLLVQDGRIVQRDRPSRTSPTPQPVAPCAHARLSG